MTRTTKGPSAVRVSTLKFPTGALWSLRGGIGTEGGASVGGFAVEVEVEVEVEGWNKFRFAQGSAKLAKRKNAWRGTDTRCNIIDVIVWK